MWALKREQFDLSKLLVEESLYTVGNGYIGIRGCLEEQKEIEGSIRGSYINGLYDRVPIVYGESAYGFPVIQDKQPRIVDTQTCEIMLDGERVYFFDANTNTDKNTNTNNNTNNNNNTEHQENLKNYYRTLDYQRGSAIRGYDYRTKSGKWAKISFERMASFEQVSTFVYQIKVAYDGEIELISVLDADVANHTDEKDPRLGKGHAKLMRCESLEADQTALTVKCLMSTQTTNLAQATVVKHSVDSPYPVTSLMDSKPLKHLTHFKGRGQMTLTKYCAFVDGLRSSESLAKAEKIAESTAKLGFDALIQSQRAYLDDYWYKSDIVIDMKSDTNRLNQDINGNRPSDQAAVRFMLYQLIQSVGRDAFSNVSAKGLSGEGYEGHYFWDTEIYVLPLLQATQPELARKLLSYRYHILPSAKARALELGHQRGATYPWRTISGIECSGYFPAGTAQYHINADIAYAFIQYHLFNGDDEFLLNMGAEVIIETARTWLEIGHFEKNTFKIHCVTGPDEYTAIVNNNYYTNAMAKYHLEWTSRLYDAYTGEKTSSHLKPQFERLFQRLEFTEAESRLMARAAEAMYLPHDEAMGIDAQDDAFLSKPVWPFESTEASKYPLLLHFHPLTIYRHQVLKQADTVLAHYLLEDYTTDEVMRKTYDYYEKITTHDSSLSACVYGIMACRIGDTDKAYDYFCESTSLDLEDTHGNTRDGLHMANIAGTALSVISGFAGFRITSEGISFRPVLPRAWSRYAFKLKVDNRLLNVGVEEVSPSEIEFTLTLISGRSLGVKINGQPHLLEEQLRIKLERK